MAGVGDLGGGEEGGGGGVPTVIPPLLCETIAPLPAATYTIGAPEGARTGRQRRVKLSGTFTLTWDANIPEPAATASLFPAVCSVGSGLYEGDYHVFASLGAQITGLGNDGGFIPFGWAIGVRAMTKDTGTCVTGDTACDPGTGTSSSVTRWGARYGYVLTISSHFSFKTGRELILPVDELGWAGREVWSFTGWRAFGSGAFAGVVSVTGDYEIYFDVEEVEDGDSATVGAFFEVLREGGKMGATITPDGGDPLTLEETITRARSSSVGRFRSYRARRANAPYVYPTPSPPAGVSAIGITGSEALGSDADGWITVDPQVVSTPGGYQVPEHDRTDVYWSPPIGGGELSLHSYQMGDVDGVARDITVYEALSGANTPYTLTGSHTYTVAGILPTKWLFEPTGAGSDLYSGPAEPVDSTVWSAAMLESVGGDTMASFRMHGRTWDQATLTQPLSTYYIGPTITSLTRWHPTGGETGAALSIVSGGIRMVGPGFASYRFSETYPVPGSQPPDSYLLKLGYRRLKVRLRSVGSSNQTVTLELIGAFLTLPTGGTRALQLETTTGPDGEWVERTLDIWRHVGADEGLYVPHKGLCHAIQFDVPSATVEVAWVQGVRQENSRVTLWGNLRYQRAWADTDAVLLTSGAYYDDNFDPPADGVLESFGLGITVTHLGKLPGPYQWAAGDIEGLTDNHLTLEGRQITGDTLIGLFGLNSHLGAGWNFADLRPAPSDWATSGRWSPDLTYLHCSKGPSAWLHGAGNARIGAIEFGQEVVAEGLTLPCEEWFLSVQGYPLCGDVFGIDADPGDFGDSTPLWGEVTLRGQIFASEGNLPNGAAIGPYEVTSEQCSVGGGALGDEGSGTPTDGRLRTGAPYSLDDDDGSGGPGSTRHRPTFDPATPGTARWYPPRFWVQHKAAFWFWLLETESTTSGCERDLLSVREGLTWRAGVEDGQIRVWRCAYPVPLSSGDWGTGALATDGPEDSGPCLIYDPRTARLRLLFFNGTGCRLRYSDDDGDTWAEEASVLSGATSADGCSDDVGGVLLVGVYQDGSDYKLRGSYKAPGDASFGADFTLKDSAAADLLVENECPRVQQAHETQGRLLMLVRIAGESDPSAWTSADSGRTWTLVP